jgi:D-alanyl-D-alanine carboxypeptidase
VIQNQKKTRRRWTSSKRLQWSVIALVLALVSLSACSRDAVSTPLPTPIAEATSPISATETIDIYPITTAISAESLESTGTPIINTPAYTPLDNGLDPCGVILPITIANEEQPASALKSSEVDLERVPSEARPALRRIMSAPSSVGLVAFEIGNEEDGIYFNADSSMPLASLTKIVNLVAYANSVDEGVLDPSAWIPISEIEQAYLPGSDLGAHRAAIAELEENGLVTEDRSIPMEQLPWMMMRHSSNAASDYLQMLLGQEVIEDTARALDLPSHTAPCPFLGQFLSISNHTRSGNDRQAVEGFIDNQEYYGQEVMRLTNNFMNDSDFRDSEGYWRAPVSVQRYFSDNLNPQASPRDYARLMSKIIQNGVGSDYVNILVRRAIEWPMIYEVNQQLFSTVGFKNGSLPGVLTIAYYGQRLVDGAQVVVVLFYRDLPMQMYRQWRQSQTHDELARWLLADPDGIDTFRAWMENTS